MRNRFKSCNGPSLCFALLIECALLEGGTCEPGADSSGGVLSPDGFGFDGIACCSPASEFFRGGVLAGLPRDGEAGAEENTWLALRTRAKGERDVEPVGDGVGSGSSSGVEGTEVWTGDGVRRPGSAERNFFEGRLVG